ncbi:MAG: hypothetical protein LBI69_01230 [Puniceicoccales bacterium]|nr:hypothetical protein [Puniceicoccales bacterium]
MIALSACTAVAIMSAVSIILCTFGSMALPPAILLTALIGVASGWIVASIACTFIRNGKDVSKSLLSGFKENFLSYLVTIAPAAIFAVVITAALVLAAPSFLATAVGLVGLSSTMLSSMIFASILGVLGATILLLFLYLLLSAVRKAYQCFSGKMESNVEEIPDFEDQHKIPVVENSGPEIDESTLLETINRLEAAENRLEEIESRLEEIMVPSGGTNALLENNLEQTKAANTFLGKRLEATEKRLGEIENRLEAPVVPLGEINILLENRLEEIEKLPSTVLTLEETVTILGERLEETKAANTSLKNRLEATEKLLAKTERLLAATITFSEETDIILIKLLTKTEISPEEIKKFSKKSLLKYWQNSANILPKTTELPSNEIFPIGFFNASFDHSTSSENDEENESPVMIEAESGSEPKNPTGSTKSKSEEEIIPSE